MYSFFSTGVVVKMCPYNRDQNLIYYLLKSKCCSEKYSAREKARVKWQSAASQKQLNEMFGYTTKIVNSCHIATHVKYAFNFN